MSFFKLLELAYRLPSISESEWEAKLLSRETQKRLGLRSPKLSKFLLGKKVPETVLQKVMLKKTITYFSSLLLEQGDSVHYSSCQARDPRAKWFKESAKSLWEEGDLQAYQEGHLLMWVAGRPMSEDGAGFKARAKIRMVYAKDGSSLLGVYVDRIYGQSELLREEDLTKLLKEKFGHEVPILALVWDSKGEEGIVPSSALGYQDTLRRSHTGPRFFRRKKKGTLEEFLKARLATPLWLRQEYSAKLEGREPRIPIWQPCKRTPKNIQNLKKVLNIPKNLKVEKQGAKWVFKYHDEKWCYHYFHLYIHPSGWTLCFGSNEDFLYRSKDRLWVVSDYPELGFYKAEPI